MIETTEVFASPFNHCSTVCPYQDGAIIAWYSGSNECQDDQSVCVIFINQNNRSDILRIGDKTGNPVLWKHGSDIFLLWSRFEDDGQINCLADRWKYCSIWVQKIEIQEKPVLIGKPERIIDSQHHLLGRCPPILFNNTILLPLYDELEGTCVIVNGTNFTEISRFGSDMIQPTLWIKGNTIHALARNFRTLCGYARYSCSKDGIDWTAAASTKILNVNNSICVTNWQKSEVVVWNDTISRYRDKLTLGLLTKNYDDLSVVSISIIGMRYGAYPFCSTHDNKLFLTFTNSRKRIEYHVWKWEDIKENCGRYSSRSSSRHNSISTERRSKS